MIDKLRNIKGHIADAVKTHTDIQIDMADGKNQLHGTVIAVFQQQSHSYTPNPLTIDRNKSIGDDDGSLYEIVYCFDPHLNDNNITYKPFTHCLASMDAEVYEIKNISWFLLKYLV